MRLTALRAIVFLAVSLSPWIAAQASAQPCSTLVCSVITSCSEGRVECRQGDCFCRAFCNSNDDCGAGKFCRPTDGLCYSRLPESCSGSDDCRVSGQICAGGVCTDPCNNRGDCTAPGQICGASTGRCGACSNNGECSSTESCVGGLCTQNPATPATPAPVTPTPCTNRGCNDGNPCNGVETCDGTRCVRGEAPCPRVQFPERMECVRGEGAREGCFECRHTRLAQRDAEGAEIVFDGQLPGGITPTPTPVARITPVPTRWPPDGPPGWGGGGRGFRFRGSIDGSLPGDPSASRVHVILADPKGKALVYQVVENGAWDEKKGRGWSGDAKLGFTFRDKSKTAAVARLALLPVAGKDAVTVEVEGSLGRTTAIDGSLAPTVALQIDWKADVSPMLIAARSLKCEPGRVKGEALRCRK